jgi:hypothetical protein
VNILNNPDKEILEMLVICHPIGYNTSTNHSFMTKIPTPEIAQLDNASDFQAVSL